MIAAFAVTAVLASACLALIVVLCVRRGIFGVMLALAILGRIGVLS